MNSNQLKFKKHIVTTSEATLKKKYDDTIAMMAAMNARNTDVELEKKLANNRRLARLQVMKEQELLQRESGENSDDALLRSNLAGGGNFSNNINVQINYTVNETTQVVNRRKIGNKSKSVVNDKKRRMKDLMNSSLSKMLDQQLLMTNETAPTPVDLTKNVAANVVSNSMTEQIFKGDKIYLNDGAMAFKPLGMETVLEATEQTLTPHRWKKKGLQTNATRISANNFVPQTTEENIAMQQRLDFASAEEFVSFSKSSQMGLFVREDKQNAAKAAQVSAEYQVLPSVLKNIERSLPQSKSVSMAQLHQEKQSVLGKTESKSSLKTVSNVSPTKRMIPEEDRQVHPGLAKIQFNLKNIPAGIATPPLEEEISSSQKSQARNQSSVKFDERSIVKKRDLSPSVITTGAVTLENPKIPISSTLQLGELLNKQTTGKTREMVRKLKEIQNKSKEEQEQNLAADTILENPLPKPHRMRSRATFQPKSIKLEANVFNPDVSYEVAPVHVDSVSQLAIDYGMHVENQNKVKHLMELILGKGKSFVQANINEVEIDIGDSMSNVNDNKSQGVMTKHAKLPNMNPGSVTDELAASTQLGTNPKHSVMNLAEYTRKQNEKSNARNPIFDSSAHQSKSVERSSEKNVNRSFLDRSISIDSSQQQQELKNKMMKSELMQKQSQSQFGHDASRLDNLIIIHDIIKGQDLDSIQKQGGDLRLHMPGSSLSGMQFQNHNRKSLHNKSVFTSKNPKYAMVRSSMFNNNPILDRMDMVQMLSDKVSDYSAGNYTTFNRKVNAVGGVNLDNQEVLSYKGAGNDHEKLSIKSSSMVRSISHKKLEPLVQKGPPEAKLTNTLRTQSLHFDKGLSYVMIKGKVRPSENYIYKQMLPYTNVQGFQSLQVKSSSSRHQLLLTQMPTKSQHSPHRVPRKGEKIKKKKNKKSNKISILKGEKKGEMLQTLESARKKGIIMEMEEEYSGSEKTFVQEDAKNETWQDVQEENTQLKEQILNQIAIFEQYLKVAILQHKTRLREAKQEAKLQGARHSLVEKVSIFNRKKDFEFDDEKTTVKQLKQTDRQRGKSKKNKRQKSKSGREQSYQTQQRSQITQSEFQPRTRKQSATRQSMLIQENQADRSVFTVAKVSREESTESVRLSKDLNQKKAIFVRLSKKVTPSIMKALEHLVPTTDPSENTHITTHTAHQIWIQKIQKLWKKLNKSGNQECVRLQNEIRRNKVHINELTRDNLFELDVNTHDQKILLDARHEHRKFKKRVILMSDIKQVNELQNRIREEIAKKADFDTWGFHDHIIQHRLKVRMTEDIIDCAQRLAVKADTKIQRELELLKLLRDRTYEDIRYFIDKREEKKWRIWDGYGGNYKPSFENRGLNFQQILQRIDINLLMIAYIEPRFGQLVRDVPPYNMINSEMIQFCTLVFGNEGWLQIFQIRRLRKQQEAEQNAKQYMPPVDHIKRFAVDPYTLQIESEPEKQTSVEREESASPKAEPVKVKESAWKIRKPEKQNQGRLKTGYEPIIAAKLQGKQSSITLEKVDDKDQANDGKIAVKETLLFKKPDSMPIESGESIYKRNRRSGVTIQESQDSVAINSNSLLPQSETPAGFGINKFEGDVIQHLKNQVAQQDRQEKVQEEVKAIQKSSWLQVLERERQEKAQREARDRAARAARLAILFEEEDVLQQDDEDMLDAGAAHRDFISYADKIDTHLQVEKRLLEAWNENDKREGGPLALAK